MKTNIGKIAMTLAMGMLLALGANGATNRLGKVKNTEYVVTSESDPMFNSWTNEQDITFNNSSVNKFKIGDQTLGQILDGKLDATNGVAFG